MTLRAVRYEILRNVVADGKIELPMAEKPVRVATILNEAHLLDNDATLVHNMNVFLEERFHDWHWRLIKGEGKLTYFTRVAKMADVLIVYEEARQ